MSDSRVDPPQILQMSPGELGIFLCGSPVRLDYADSDGAGQIAITEDASEDWSADEQIGWLTGAGMEFYIDHPVTGEEITVLVQVR